MGPLMRTHMVTREDFNIEDLHCQIVGKIQRTKNLLRDIEGLPGERDPICEIIADEAEFYSGRKGGNNRSGQRSSS